MRGAITQLLHKGPRGLWMSLVGGCLVVTYLLVSIWTSGGGGASHAAARRPRGRLGPMCATGCAPYPANVAQQYTDLNFPLRTPDLSIDALIRIYRREQGTLDGVVLCRRRNPPQLLAIPGGFVEYGESVEDALRREVLEETRIDLSGSVDRTGKPLHVGGTFPGMRSSLQQFRVYSDPLRDRRRHTVSVAFDVIVFDRVPQASDDVKECAVFNVSALRSLRAHDFAFDHHTMLVEYLDAVALGGVG